VAAGATEACMIETAAFVTLTTMESAAAAEAAAARARSHDGEKDVLWSATPRAVAGELYWVAAAKWRTRPP
jgi:hypothetical protein